MNLDVAAPLARRGAEIFARYDEYDGPAFRYHCERLAAFCSLLARKAGQPWAPGVAELLSYVHDLGLLTRVDEGPSYMHRSLSLLRRECEEHFGEDGSAFGFSKVEVEELLLLNHRLFPVPGASRPAETLRQAVWVEHTRGLQRYGLSHSEVKDVFDRYPRLDLDWVLLDFAKRTFAREPKTLVSGIFF